MFLRNFILGTTFVLPLLLFVQQAEAQTPTRASTFSTSQSNSINYGRKEWNIDMRRNKLAPGERAVVPVSREYAHLYPVKEIIDAGSLHFVNHRLDDGKGGHYQQTGFIWTEFGQYRQCMKWVYHYRLPLSTSPIAVLPSRQPNRHEMGHTPPYKPNNNIKPLSIPRIYPKNSKWH